MSGLLVDALRTIVIAMLAVASTLAAPSANALAAEVPGEVASGSLKAARHYSGGPLTEDDFQARPPGDGKLAASYQAFLFVDIVWTHQYRTVSRGRVSAAQLTRFEASAVCNPSKSWSRWGKKKSELLDHEQGHFNIAQIHARLLEIKMRKLLAAKKPPLAHGESDESAAEALATLLEKEYRAAKAASDEENREYDKATLHGTSREKQSELRHIQQETLKKLDQELQGLKKK